MAVSDPNAFAERVNYAARCILNGRTNSRAFDACVNCREYLTRRQEC